MLHGTVVDFDAHKGYGHVGSDQGRFFFHCTRIAGGDRIIEVGTKVVFRVVPGHLGRWEASDVTPLDR